jgi:hypothetical protein
MTIKVGCGKCNASFAVRDDFAGKAVKCPKCKSPMQVPAVTKPSATGKAPAVARKTTAGTPSSGRKFNPLLDLLDEAGVEAKSRGRSCPMCAAEMASNAIICVQCGFNSATGERLETAVLVGDDDLGKEQTDAEKLLAKAEREIDEMPVSSFGQDFGEGKESYLIATVAMICMTAFVALGVGTILFMDNIIDYFEISPEAISLGAAIVIATSCIAYITFIAFKASPGHGIACLASCGLYCVLFGFMQGKGLLVPTIMLLVSAFVGLVSGLFLAYGVGRDALDTMLWSVPPGLYLG